MARLAEPTGRIFLFRVVRRTCGQPKSSPLWFGERILFLLWGRARLVRWPNRPSACPFHHDEGTPPPTGGRCREIAVCIAGGRLGSVVGAGGGWGAQQAGPPVRIGRRRSSRDLAVVLALGGEEAYMRWLYDSIRWGGGALCDLLGFQHHGLIAAHPHSPRPSCAPLNRSVCRARRSGARNGTPGCSARGARN